MPDGDAYALRLPNIRACFKPDPGFVLVEADLERADAQVCAWDAGCDALKVAFQRGDDIHTENAIMLYGEPARINARTIHVNGLSFRDNGKRWVHATDYAGGARTISQHIALQEDRVRAAINWWIHKRHPEIGEWHKRYEYELTSRSVAQVRNAFGFRRVYIDRSTHLLGQALAWVCQSTVAIVINKGMLNIYRNLPQFQLLMQIHDSLLMQVREEILDDMLIGALKREMAITVPYPDPLVIPIEVKWSASDWGSMQKWKSV